MPGPSRGSASGYDNAGIVSSEDSTDSEYACDGDAEDSDESNGENVRGVYAEDCDNHSGEDESDNDAALVAPREDASDGAMDAVGRPPGAPEPAEGGAMWTPPSGRLNLSHGRKSVLSLDCNPAGNHVASGSIDSVIRLWDLASVDPRLSFHTMQAVFGPTVNGIRYSNNGDQILVVCGTEQVHILDCHGTVVGSTSYSYRGEDDVLRRVTAHRVKTITYGAWNPCINTDFVTLSVDGKCRVWSSDSLLCHKTIFTVRNCCGEIITPTTCNFHPDGRFAAVGCSDGSIQFWDVRSPVVGTPCTRINSAHWPHEDISCISFSYSGNLFGSRAVDTYLKLFDIRFLAKQVHSISALPCRFPETTCTFNPCDSMLVTGTSGYLMTRPGKVLFFDVNTFRQVHEIVTDDTGVIATVWHPITHKIIISLANGGIYVYHDLDMVIEGARMCREPEGAAQLDLHAPENAEVIPINEEEDPNHGEQGGEGGHY